MFIDDNIDIFGFIGILLFWKSGVKQSGKLCFHLNLGLTVTYYK